jgi:hypothetical protein
LTRRAKQAANFRLSVVSWRQQSLETAAPKLRYFLGNTPEMFRGGTQLSSCVRSRSLLAAKSGTGLGTSASAVISPHTHPKKDLSARFSANADCCARTRRCSRIGRYLTGENRPMPDTGRKKKKTGEKGMGGAAAARKAARKRTPHEAPASFVKAGAGAQAGNGHHPGAAAAEGPAKTSARYSAKSPG